MKKEAKNVLIAVSFNALFLIAYLFLADFAYDLPDNVGYSEYISSGEYHIIFMNYFYCLFVGVLQKLLPNVSMFFVCFVIWGYLSFVTITKVMLDKFKAATAILFTCFLNCFFAINHYRMLSFTLTPGILCSAGYLAIIHYAQRKSRSGIMWGALLVIIGASIRFRIFEVATAVAFVYVAADALAECIKAEYRFRRFPEYMKQLFEPIRFCTVVVVIAICFISNFLSTKINIS